MFSTSLPLLERRCLMPGPEAWAAVAAELRSFAGRRGLSVRDLWVIVPFAQHLPLAREAWAQTCPAGWMPRFETTETLAAALSPRREAIDAAPTGDVLVDRLAAARLLSGQAWADGARRRDPAVFQHWVRLLVDTVHQLLEGAACQPLDQREAWWAQVQERLQARAGGQLAAGEVEGALVRMAGAWARLREGEPTDALFHARPAAWAVVQAGEADALMQAVLTTSPVPALWLDLNPPASGIAAPGAAAPALRVCQDTEDEAQAAAARVIRHVADGEVPVALVAQDRGLVRRIRALLDRERVHVHDETGWKLSTTRAGACVMGLLRLSGPRSATEEALDWLKGGFVDLPGTDGQAVQQLEAELRRQRVAWVAQVPVESLPAPARALWQGWLEACRSLAQVSSASLAQWQQALMQALERCGAWARLMADPAGLQLLQALRLEGEAAGPYAQQARQLDFDRADYVAWVDEVLEASSFRPAPMEPVEVVIAPLSRCLLRPFAAVVMPGCDHSHLGAPASIGGCLSESERRDLGLPTRERAWQRERSALAHVLAHPRLSLSWRLSHQGEPLQASPLLEPLHLALRRAQQDWTKRPDARRAETLAGHPVGPTQPSAPGLLPHKLSATAYEALRACPYRFFALRMLGLEEVESLDDEPDRRDQGTWLHAVLHAFHTQRMPGSDPGEDLQRLLAIAQAQRRQQRLDEAAFLAEWLHFERLAPAYLAWLYEQEAQGWQFERGEWSVSVPGPGSAVLRGVLDRVDRSPQGDRVRLIDYKTSSADSLRARVRAGQGLEDTQLAFYATLWGGAEEGGAQALEAGYLALDAPVQWIEHRQVADSAAALREGLAEDLRRLAAGAALPPLGEGPACTHCAAAGLCRKAHWADVAEEGPA
jgi:ATP-dependent helicase/nuclease subunit B